MDSDTAWRSVDELVDALSSGDVPTGYWASKPTQAAVLGAKLALRLFRSEGTTISACPPAILTMPWGSIVFWWRSVPQRRVEVISRHEAYEYLDGPDGSVVRRFMSGPPAQSQEGRPRSRSTPLPSLVRTDG